MTQPSPLIVFWLLLAGGAIAVILARTAPRLVKIVLAFDSTIALILWQTFRSRLPLQVTLSNWPAAAGLPSWHWHIDELTWQSGGLLLLLLTGALFIDAQGRASETDAAMGTAHRFPFGATALWLVAAGLLNLGADSLAAAMSGWALMVALWSVAFLSGSDRSTIGVDRLIPRLRWLLLSLFFLWLASATAPSPTSIGWNLGDWSRVPSSSVLTAALLQMGVWPFHGWRPSKTQFQPTITLLLHMVPTLIGASLLSRWFAASDMSTGYRLFLTAFALLGLVFALYGAWTHLGRPGRVTASLALGLANMALLSGIWAGPAALTAEVRVMVLATAVLLLAIGTGEDEYLWPRRIAAGLALASIAGLPLTAGIIGRSALYDVWLESGRYALLITTALVVAFLVAAILRLIREDTARDDAHPARPGLEWLRHRWLRWAGVTLLVVGLISVNLAHIAAVRAISWFVTLLSAAGGYALFRYLRPGYGITRALERAFSFELGSSFESDLLRPVLTQGSIMFRSSIVLLEGEGGLLWLLLIVILFFMSN